uniref:Uncharacterized protein n=1 Tax=Rhizophora mucronata TaxID=61149 RepID=A0A2P2PAL0_RHIMU
MNLSAPNKAQQWKQLKFRYGATVFCLLGSET